jgi:uncharacterized protein
MEIPYEKLSSEALEGLIEEFCTRDGTDNTDRSAKMAKVMSQLKSGDIYVGYDVSSETTNLVARE